MRDPRTYHHLSNKDEICDQLPSAHGVELPGPSTKKEEETKIETSGERKSEPSILNHHSSLAVRSVTLPDNKKAAGVTSTPASNIMVHLHTAKITGRAGRSWR